MAKEKIGAAGMTRGPVQGADVGATRNSPPLSAQEQEANRQSDEVNIADAKTNIANNNMPAANQNVANIHDPQKRIEMHNQLAAAGGAESPPASLFKDGSGGLSDPLALFFMMVFYLDKASPTFNWNDVLKTASDNGGDNVKFGTIKVEDGFLPQRRFSDSNVQTPPVVSSSAGNTSPETTRELNTKQTEVGAQKDANPNPTAVSQGQGTSEKKAGNVIVWPTQTMPIISGGMNKSVDWPSQSVATLAEPVLSLNKGASPIEIDIEFVYAVGTFGIGDGEISGYSSVGDKDRGGEPASTSEPPLTNRQKGWWTVEEIMGAMYLATSLVYPFKSSQVVSKGVKDKESAGAQAQFPVIFMRHYSLFPFLTPFVVKAVKIEPDEEQPLIVTEPLNLNKTMKSHLTFPAVRQVVKITLSMISAHYYLPVFGGKDEGNQIQIQTSGETYLALAQSLLGKRLEK
jgi:hypothetical protein